MTKADAAWWDGRPFDAILLDVPCSGTGVIRRHPDIKLLRRATDIPALVERQRLLLRHCWRWLRDGGRLLYVTCSVLPEENGDQVAAFLAKLAYSVLLVAVAGPAGLHLTPAFAAVLAECGLCGAKYAFFGVRAAVPAALAYLISARRAARQNARQAAASDTTATATTTVAARRSPVKTASKPVQRTPLPTVQAWSPPESPATLPASDDSQVYRQH